VDISSTLNQYSAGQPDIGLLSEKIRGIKTASELISDKLAEDSGAFDGGPVAAQMCYSELALVLQVLEKCFVDGLEGDKLLKIIKEIILKADGTL